MSRRRLISRRIMRVLLVVSAFPAAPQDNTGLTMELVEQRIAVVRSSDRVDDVALQSYEQAKTLLDQSETFDREAATYIDAVSSAAAREAEIQDRLDATDDLADSELDLDQFTAEELTAQLALTRSRYQDLDSQLDSLDRRLAARETNTASIRSRLEQIDLEVDGSPEMRLDISPASGPSQAEAVRWRDQARTQALISERRAKEAQLASQPARYSVMAAERVEIATNLERVLVRIRALEEKISTSVRELAGPAQLSIDVSDPAFQVASTLADRDASLREGRLRINDGLAVARRRNDQIDERVRALHDRRARTRRIVDFAGDSDVLGRVLLAYWKEIDDFEVADPTDQLSREVGDVVISRIDHEEELVEVLSANGFVNQQLRDTGTDPATISERSREQLLALARTYRERLRGVITAESAYIEVLGELESDYRSLTDQIRAYREYLQGLVLWIPDHPPLWTLTGESLTDELDLIALEVQALSYTFRIPMVLAAIVALALLAGRRRIAILLKTNSGAGQAGEHMGSTLLALAAASFLAMPIPLLILGLAGGFQGDDVQGNQIVLNLLAVTALLLFSLSMLRIVSEPAGIGEMHFGWRKMSMKTLHDNASFLLFWGLPLVAFATLANQLAPDAEQAIIARALMCLALILVGYRFSRAQLRELRITGSAWMGRTTNQLRIVLSVLLLAALVSIFYGQLFSVSLILRGLIETVWIGTGVLLAHAVMMRWLRVTGSRLSRKETAAEAPRHSGEEGASVAEQAPDLSEVSSETRQLINLVSLVAAAMIAYYIWRPLLPALEVFSRLELWTSTTHLDGETIVNQITLATLLTVTFLAGLTLFAARRLPALVELILRGRTSISPGARYATSTLLNYLIIGAGTVAALSALGLKWSQLQWLVAALGVGIGFGLQEIVANFISGIIILFERPIRVGDVITIGDKDGTVIRIRIRATTIRDWDGKELLVPNKEFIAGRLLNWTLSDSQTRLVLPVGIAYGSDVEKALRILMDVVASYPTVLGDPPPSVLFLGFGDNALNLVARCFLSDVEDRMPTISALNNLINQAFNDAGIVIAFPQRDVHLDSAAPIRVSIDTINQPQS